MIKNIQNVFGQIYIINNPGTIHHGLHGLNMLLKTQVSNFIFTYPGKTHRSKFFQPVPTFHLNKLIRHTTENLCQTITISVALFCQAFHHILHNGCSHRFFSILQKFFNGGWETDTHFFIFKTGKISFGKGCDTCLKPLFFSPSLSLL